ncbi:hypothetical protein ACIQU4_40980 [Streptomyces sp. NPDC090741]|uniref:hypothetical protein n=1 Tax=Streptomyces sp. NPDC090741 TaxID=3365967 RepID=UPI0038160C20
MAAARTDVVAIRDRLAAGEALLDRYLDSPDSLDGQERERRRTLVELARTGRPEVDYRGLGIGQYAAAATEQARQLLVVDTDLAPLMIYAAGLRGRNPETLKELPAAHRILEDRAVVVTLTKRRRGKANSRTTVHWSTDADPARRLRTVGGFYLLLHEMMARSRALSKTASLWSIWAGNGSGRTTNAATGGHVGPFDAELARKLHLGRWALRHGLLGDDGRPLNLRLTRMRYLRKDPFVREWAAEILTEAITDAHDQTLAVVAPSRREGSEADQLRAGAGELDTLAASCLDIDHHPVHGGRCRESFLACLDCPNAMVLERHLPTLLALADMLRADLERRDAEQWVRRHGRTWQIITAGILPRFTAAQHANAARAAARPPRRPPGDAMTTLTSAVVAWQPVPAKALVLAERPLREDAVPEETSVFADDVWILDSALLRADRRPTSLKFAGLPAAHVTVAKHLFYALLTQDTPPGERPITIASIHSYFSCTRRFFLWAQPRAESLAELTAQDLAAYHHEVGGLRQVPGSTRRHRRAVRMLWAYRTRLPVSQRLVCDPVRIPDWQAWARTQTHRGGENLTERIPEQVMGPLLTWALRWVDDFADDVLGVRTVRAALDARPAPCLDPLPALARLLAEFRERGTPLPATPRGRGGQRIPATANITHLGRLMGCGRGLEKSTAAARLIEEAAVDLGIAEDSYLDHRVRGRLDGRPWLAEFSYYDVPRHLSLLQTACWVVIAYLSGMRDSEIKHLKRGCGTALQDPGGKVYRHELTSLAFKGEADPRGVTARWIVTAPVARAVAVLERLQPDTQAFLFTPAGGRALTVSRLPAAGRVAGSTTTVTKLAAFTVWVNDYCATTGRTDRIPDVNGRPPHLTTRQFRRTLAWFIARHPAGAIAGALQFRHQRIQMFEGYAGTSDSGFRAEVEAEEALTRGQLLADSATDPDRPRLTGPPARKPNSAWPRSPATPSSRARSSPIKPAY